MLGIARKTNQKRTASKSSTGTTQSEEQRGIHARTAFSAAEQYRKEWDSRYFASSWCLKA